VKEDLVKVKVLEKVEQKEPEPEPLTYVEAKATENKGQVASDDFSKVWGLYTRAIGIVAAIGAVLLAITLWILLQPS